MRVKLPESLIYYGCFCLLSRAITLLADMAISFFGANIVRILLL